MPSRFAMWSPHRDSREVILWKSMLGFRSEPWHWVDDPDRARWHVVDVARGVDPAWTQHLSDHASVRGIALARHWTDVPAPCWTFFKVPLQLDSVARWLDQLHRPARLRSVPTGAGADPAAARRPGGLRDTARPAGQPIAISWQGQLLRLTRWPDINRYSDGSMELTVVCARLLREWAPYDELIASTRHQHGLRSLLRDAQLNGSLRTAPAGQVTPLKRTVDATRQVASATVITAAATNAVAAAATAATRPAPAATAPHDLMLADGADVGNDQRRWGLLRRLWSRFA